MAPARRTNGLAIAALVCAIVWILWIGSLLGVIFGFVSLNQIRRSGGTQGGKGLAVAGIVVGFVGLGILVLYIALIASGVIHIHCNNGHCTVTGLTGTT
jgi:uncharacterized membrane protein